LRLAAVKPSQKRDKTAFIVSKVKWYGNGESNSAVGFYMQNTGVFFRLRQMKKNPFVGKRYAP